MVFVREGLRSFGRLFVSASPASTLSNRTPVRMPASSLGISDRVRPFLRYGQDGQSKKSAVDCPDAAENGGSTKHHRGDCEQLIAGSRVGLRLSNACHIDQRRER